MCINNHNNIYGKYIFLLDFLTYGGYPEAPSRRLGKLSKLVENARKSMGVDDKIQKTYSGRMDGKYGYLIITMNKVLFLKEEGFLSKSYATVFNLPFEKMRGYNVSDKYNLEFTDATGARKVFVSEIPADVVSTSLNTQKNVQGKAIPVT